MVELVKWKEEGNMLATPHFMVMPAFMTRIMNEPLPLNFKTLTIKKFKGVRDSHENIMAY